MDVKLSVKILTSLVKPHPHAFCHNDIIRGPERILILYGTTIYGVLSVIWIIICEHFLYFTK